MTDSLRDVLAKVKQQREADKLKDAKAKEVPAPKQEEYEEDAGDIDTSTLIEEVVEAPKLKPKLLPKAPIMPVPIPIPIAQPVPMPNLRADMQPKPEKTETDLIIEEIEMLHNNGIYRRELIVSIRQLNKNLSDLNKLIGGI